MSLLDLFGINKEVSPSDVIRNAPDIESKIDKTKTRADELLKEINPDLVNNLNIDNDSTTTGGITEIRPKAFSAIDNIYNTLTQPRVGNFGIMDLIQTNRFISNPSLFSGLFSPVGALGIIGLKKLFSNIRDPYKSAFGGLNRQTREAINRESVRDLQDRIDKGQFGSTTPTPQDARRGGQYDGGGGSKTGGGFSSSERGAALHG